MEGALLVPVSRERAIFLKDVSTSLETYQYFFDWTIFCHQECPKLPVVGTP
jgi:hypothetical protein